MRLDGRDRVVMHSDMRPYRDTNFHRDEFPPTNFRESRDLL